MISVVIGVLSLILIGTGLFYFVATTGFGMLEGRRQSRAGPAAATSHGAGSAHTAGAPTAGGAVPGDSTPGAVYFLVPCLNEQGVIGSTLTHLLQNREARVVIVDDASDDRTAEIVRNVGGERTLLISRRLPAARQGKGMALNAGFPAILTDAKRRGLDPADVVIGVMDADGYLSDGALPHVLQLFADPRVGGAQLGVRISNRKVNLLTAMQDFEFWGLAATAQMGRVRLGTVSLGGNGQFTRLSAMCGLGEAPWSTALTEDLDLALRLMEKGWRLTTTPDAAVYQQAVLTLPALIRQRTRWFQGHMACIGHLRSMWGSPTMSNLALLEVSAYLLIPWVFILPWSILFHLGLWELLGRLASAPNTTLGGNGLVVRGITVVAWYLLGFGPSLFGGYLYYRQDRSVGKARAIVLGHELVLCNYVAFISCWLAAFRSLRGRRGWEKTVRRTEGGAEYLAPARVIASPGRAMGRLRPRPEVRPVVAPRPLAASQPTTADRPLAATQRRADDGLAGGAGRPVVFRFAGSEAAPAPISSPALSPVSSPVPVAATTRGLAPSQVPASTTDPVAGPAPPQPLTPPPSPRVRAIVSHSKGPAGRRAAPRATVRAKVTGGPMTPSPAPPLTGRLRVAPSRERPPAPPNSLGSRFLTDKANLGTVSTLEEETA